MALDHPNQTGPIGTECLEQQYLPWANAQVILDNWAQMSASYLKRVDRVRNIPYGTAAGTARSPETSGR